MLSIIDLFRTKKQATSKNNSIMDANIDNEDEKLAAEQEQDGSFNSLCVGVPDESKSSYESST
jgi:hypothetical protein